MMQNQRSEKALVSHNVLFCYYSFDPIGRFVADITFLIKGDDVGDSSALSFFNGIQHKKTAIVISEQFLFDRYIYAHEFGHVLGCGHETFTSKYLQSLLFLKTSR